MVKNKSLLKDQPLSPFNLKGIVVIIIIIFCLCVHTI